MATHNKNIMFFSSRHPSQAPAPAPGAQLNNWLLARVVGVHAVIKLSLSAPMWDPLLASQSLVTTDPGSTDHHDEDIPGHHQDSILQPVPKY